MPRSRLLYSAMLMSSFITVTLFAQTAVKPAIGNGKSDNPYQISTLNNLYWLAQNKENGKYHYIQTADINAAETKNWFGGQGWIPIGYFTGSYNGKGHVIDSLFINRPDSSCIGLFGVCESFAIDSLGVSNVNIKGGDVVGGLVGIGRGTISNCYSTGVVTGRYTIGGLAGTMEGTISNSYSTVTVNCSSNAGGLAAEARKLINCYSAGAVTGGTAGGLVNKGKSEKSSFWDTQSSGQTASSGGTGKTTDQMKTKSTFIDSGWDFVGETSNGTKDIWDIDNNFNDGYPFLVWQKSVPQNTPVLIPVDPNPTNNQKPTLKWYSLEVTASYRLQISSNEQFSSLIISIPISDTFYTPSVTLPCGTIFWRVSNENDTTCWSSISSFIIVDSLTPLLISYTPNPTINRRPELMWYKVANASSYSIQISTSVSFSSPLISDVVSDTSYTPSTDLPIGKIFWKVKSDIGSQYSLIDSITILNDSIPFLVSMSPDTLSNARPTFKWFSATGASLYKIQIDTSQNFSNPYISVPVNDTMFIPSANLPEGKIFWRVSTSTNPDRFSQIDSFVIVKTGVRSHNAVINKINLRVVHVTNQKQHIIIEISVKRPGIVSFQIITLNGATIASFNIGQVSKGTHTFKLDMRSNQNRMLSRGNYLLICNLDGMTITRKIIVE